MHKRKASDLRSLLFLYQTVAIHQKISELAKIEHWYTQKINTI